MLERVGGEQREGTSNEKRRQADSDRFRSLASAATLATTPRSTGLAASENPDVPERFEGSGAVLWTPAAPPSALEGTSDRVGPADFRFLKDWRGLKSRHQYNNGIHDPIYRPFAS